MRVILTNIYNNSTANTRYEKLDTYMDTFLIVENFGT